MIYGALPEDLGEFPLSPTEMMLWLYCPIKIPYGPVTLPDNLRQFASIVMGAYLDTDRFTESYVYLTAKTFWSAPGCVGNRPGWHTDGFGTDDLNYIWYDRAPTEFIEDTFELPDDCEDAIAFMSARAETLPIQTFPCKHLLRLDARNVHRPPVKFAPGMRSFVKVSVSKDRYNLEGNSLNHKLDEQWDFVPRLPERNHPSRAA
jgi:hypothetical protein